MGIDLSKVDAFLKAGTNILFEHIVLYVFVVVAVLFTILIRGSQFKYMFHAGSLLFAKHHGGGTSGFASYAISTASRVGTGNMAGIMAAVTAGGPGALFWMWIMALFGSALAFAEATLAQFYKEKNSDGQYVGGASFYIRNRLKLPIAATIFAVIMIITYTAFNGVQANTISKALSHSSYGISTGLTGVILTIIVAFILLSPGRTAVIKVCTYLVPIMAIPFLLLGVVVIIMNISEVPHMFSLIVSKAFNPDAAFGGAIGTTIAVGLKRGLFSNEAGMGGAPHAAAAATTTHPVRQGFIQMFSVFTDTLLICSVSGFILLLSPEAMDELLKSDKTYEGIALMQYAMQTHFGAFGAHFITLCVLLFSFSSILGNFFYIQTGVASIKDSRIGYYLVVMMTLLLVLGGSIASLDTIWNLGDFLMGFMAILNIIFLVMLYKPVKTLLDHYLKQWNEEKIPVYIKGDLPEIETDAVSQWDGSDASSVR